MQIQKFSKFKKGFTLIELLIVITIIGILAVALLPSVLGAPARARNAARKADLNNIISALELYNSDNGYYPKASGANGSCLSAVNDKGNMATDLGKYIQGGKVQKDPTGQGLGGCTDSYLYCQMNGSPASYMVAAKMEGDSDANADIAKLPTSGCNDTTATVGDLFEVKKSVYAIAK